MILNNPWSIIKTYVNRGETNCQLNIIIHSYDVISLQEKKSHFLSSKFVCNIENLYVKLHYLQTTYKEKFVHKMVVSNFKYRFIRM